MGNWKRRNTRDQKYMKINFNHSNSKTSGNENGRLLFTYPMAKVFDYRDCQYELRYKEKG